MDAIFVARTTAKKSANFVTLYDIDVFLYLHSEKN